ncbi:MAG: Class A beta-lactamase [uncultured Sphingomonadaceae bacterium]|uniref:Beta-lactamase n=1 Tax=uncultured Sphingomonadaceae bacterium TaxID=169976 RepID=A0A6J4TJU8_9SPHN|nr:MAG: Class A beta-lactamase [uncultured Sphingomonadaceae bacterium]
MVMRTVVCRGVLAALLCLATVSTNSAAVAGDAKLGDTLTATVARIEARTGGRLGVRVTDLATDQTWSHRGGERFPIASTFKAYSCGHLLSLVDKGQADLGKRVRVMAGDVLSYAPVTKNRVGGDMTLAELCEATTSMSDNTAANLILRDTGGPEAFTRFMRSIGDETTRLDRYEPDLNVVGPGEVRDTTSPDAAAASLRSLILGDTLSDRSREQLKTWLVNNQVGGPLLRASLPKEWRIADRTGSGEYGSRGVVAVIWPEGNPVPTRGPVVAAVYLTGTTLSLEERNTVIAEVGAAMARDLQR